RLHAILRHNGQSGDVVDVRPTAGFEIVCVGWGARGTTLHRNGRAAGASKGITGISSDPSVGPLDPGGPGAGGSPRFAGDLAEVRVYNRQLTDAERRRVEDELRDAWFKPSAPKPLVPRDPLAELYEELLSSQGPFWLSAEERTKLLAPEVRTR